MSIEPFEEEFDDGLTWADVDHLIDRWLAAKGLKYGGWAGVPWKERMKTRSRNKLIESNELDSIS